MEENIHSEIMRDLNQYGTLQNNGNTEVAGYRIYRQYDDIGVLMDAKEDFEELYAQSLRPWRHKQMMEAEHYKKLEGGLLHSIAENKYYLKEKINESRRFVVTSSDCISVIQIMFRDDKIYCGVYFRSSHAENLLPVDLDFIYGLVFKSMEYLEARAGTETFEDVTPELLEKMACLPVIMDLHFGSLHTN